MKRLFVLIVTLFISTMAMAQKSDVGFAMSGAFKGSTALSNKPLTTNDIDIVWGYHFNDRWALTAPFTSSVVMYPNTTTYSAFTYFGLGGEYLFCKSDIANLSVVARVQSSIGKNDWGGVMAYELGVMEEFDSVIASIGLKYLDANRSHINDRLCIYFSFGFRLR